MKVDKSIAAAEGGLAYSSDDDSGDEGVKAIGVDESDKETESFSKNVGEKPDPRPNTSDVPAASSANSSDKSQELLFVDYYFIKHFSRAAKKARTNGIRNMLRRIEDESKTLKDPASGEGALQKAERRRRNSKLNLEALQAVKARFITLRGLADDGIAVHRRLWQDWNLSSQAARDQDAAENGNVDEETMKRALNFLKNNKQFREARARMIEAASSSPEDASSKRAHTGPFEGNKGAKRQRVERKVACRATGCNAMFATKEAMEQHVKRRHTSAAGGSGAGGSNSMFVDSLAEENIDELIKPQKKNRMGQRQRRRQAILKEIAEGKYEGKEVPALDRPSRAKMDAWKAKQAQKGDKGIAVPDHRNKPRPEKNVPAATNDGIDESHPSWAAKRAQKQKAMDGFKGKKITFGDDGDSDDEE